MHRFHSSLLDTCRELDGWQYSDDTGPSSNGVRPLPDAPAGLMTVDFHDDANWRKEAPAAPTSSALS
ncbi:hypothetical protein PG994_014467 [Apiospora phragmitis]|uniref:Uncharacterized protein n=1 Tax=Apiospora phragmitis TaxID=2905665 RepID=A0ABR1T4D5_9PEZI